METPLLLRINKPENQIPKTLLKRLPNLLQKTGKNVVKLTVSSLLAAVLISLAISLGGCSLSDNWTTIINQSPLTDLMPLVSQQSLAVTDQIIATASQSATDNQSATDTTNTATDATNTAADTTTTTTVAPTAAQDTAATDSSQTDSTSINTANIGSATILSQTTNILQNIISQSRSLAYNQSPVGFYGGNQESPIEYYENEHHMPELRAILAEYPCFAGISDETTHVLLEGICDNGCTYTALANTIMEKYYFNASGYQTDFGFPMFRTEDGQQVLNYEPLITDIYCFAVQSRCSDGQLATADLFRGLKRSEFAIFSDYVAAKTNGRVQITVATEDFDPTVDWSALMDQGSIAVSAFAGTSYLAIRSGTSIAFQSLEPGEGHATSLTGVENQSQPYAYMVSSWGNAYYLTDLGFADYCLEMPGADPKYFKGDPPAIPAGATLYNISPWIVTVSWS